MICGAVETVCVCGDAVSPSVLTAEVETAEHTCVLLCCGGRVKQYLSELLLLLDETGDLEMGRMPCQAAQLSHKWLFNGWKEPRHTRIGAEVSTDVHLAMASRKRQKQREKANERFSVFKH